MDFANLDTEQSAAAVCQALADAGITVTLTGGACVAIWTEGLYVSDDLDFVEEGPVPRRQVRTILSALGFRETKRHFTHPGTTLFVEFPNGPLMVGDERVTRAAERETPVGRLRLLTPTDCVKDRLAAYFHWNDAQALEQAVLVATAQAVDLDDIARWSQAEGEARKYGTFLAKLRP